MQTALYSQNPLFIGNDENRGQLRLVVGTTLYSCVRLLRLGCDICDTSELYGAAARTLSRKLRWGEVLRWPLMCCYISAMKSTKRGVFWRRLIGSLRRICCRVKRGSWLVVQAVSSRIQCHSATSRLCRAASSSSVVLHDITPTTHPTNLLTRLVTTFTLSSFLVEYCRLKRQILDLAAVSRSS